MVPPWKPLCSQCGVVKTCANSNERSLGHFMAKCRECDGTASGLFTKKGKLRRKAGGGVIRTSSLPPEIAKQIEQEFIVFPGVHSE